MGTIKTFGEWLNESVSFVDQKELNKFRKNKVRDVFEALKKNYIAQYFDLPVMKTLDDDETYVWWHTAQYDAIENENEQVYGAFFLEDTDIIDWPAEGCQIKLHSFAVSYNMTIGGEKVSDAIIELNDYDAENNEDGDIQRLEYDAEKDVWEWTANKGGELQPNEFGESKPVSIQAIIESITEGLNPHSKYLKKFFKY